jgi:hypothetical protein
MASRGVVTDFGRNPPMKSKKGMLIFSVGLGLITAAVSGVLIWLYVFRKSTPVSSSSSSSSNNTAMKPVLFEKPIEKTTTVIKNATFVEKDKEEVIDFKALEGDEKEWATV